MGKQLVTKIRGMNPLMRKGTLMLLALLVSFACLSVPRSADAAVVALTNWKNTAGTAIAGTTYFRGTTALPGATNAYGAIAAGADRLMVVALTVNTSVAQTSLVPTVTYGGQAFSMATTDIATSSRQHTWLFYLKEAQIAAAVGTNLSFTYTGNGGLVYTGTYANAAVYRGVDQGTPYQYATTYNNGATASLTEGPLPISQVVVAGDYAVEINNSLRTGVATAPTVTLQAGWTSRGSTTRTGTVPAAYAMRSQIAYRNTAGLWSSTHTASVAVLNSMSAMTIKQIIVPGVGNGAAVPALVDVWASDADKVVDAFTFTGGGQVAAVTITGNANITPAFVSQAHVYRKVGTNLTAYEAADIMIGSTSPASSPFTITFTTPETINTAYNYIITYDIASGALANGTANTLTGRVTAITPVTGGTGTVNDTTGATLTVLPTTSINDTTEPAPARLKNGSAATMLNNFTVKHTGISPTDDDSVTGVTVTLSPTTISGGTAATLSKIKKVEITNAAGTVVYGTAFSAIVGDTWNIPLSPVFTITTAPTTYSIRISTADSIIPSRQDPSCLGWNVIPALSTCSGYYPVSGKITGFLHTQSNNKAVITDANPAGQISIDFEEPGEVGAFTALEPQVGDTDGTLNLTWNAATDPNAGTLAATAYKIVRGAANGGVPNPHCIDGTDVGYTGNAGNFTDSGLISTQATQYKYRICTIDSLGNHSNGVTAYGKAKVVSSCNNAPIFKLSPVSQIIKTTGTVYALNVSNMDTGVCTDMVVSLALTAEGGSNPAHFTKSYPATITVGTGGAGHASTGATALFTIGATGSAVQLETYEFKVVATTPGHGTGSQTTPLVTGLLNDMPPIVHNSANMNKFGYGGWGQTYTCATCHSNSTTNIKGIFTLVSTPIGRRNVTFTKTSAASNDYIGVMGNDGRPVKNISTYVCSVCHHQTRQHQYSANKAFGGPNNNETYISSHQNSKDCATCHTHNTAFAPVGASCGECHGDKNTGYAPVDAATMVKDVTNALGPLPPGYGAHARHNAINVACTACHSNSNHTSATGGWLGNQDLEMGFTASSATFAGFNAGQTVVGGTFYGTSNLNYPYNINGWKGAPGTTISALNDYNNSCLTYCHGSWTGNTGNGSQQQPIWYGGSVEVICGSCHYATGTTPPTSGSHSKHSATTGAGLGIECVRCHAPSPLSNFTGAAHINGSVQWNLTQLSGGVGGARYNGAPSGSTANIAGGTTFGQCSNLYCHSSVQSGATGTGLPAIYATPTWGSTITCGDCHAQPNTTGNHTQHEANADGIVFDCHVCHYNGGTTTPVNHANGQINFQFTGLAAGTTYSLGNNVAPQTAFGSCNSSCHGRDQRNWGMASSGNTLCDKCHGSATSAGGFFGTKGPGSSTFENESGVGMHEIHIQNPNGTQALHRKSAFASFTSFAVGFSCKHCHYNPSGPFSAGHIDTALPAEAGFDNLSSIAHNGDTFGYYSSPTFNPTTKSCNNIWCHGAGMNSNRANGSYAGTTPPGRAVPLWNATQFTGNRLADCNICHSIPPPAPNSSYTHYGKTMSQCNQCHLHLSSDGLGFDNKKLHVNGSIDGGCGGCHGNPPITSDISVITNPNNTGLATPAQNALPAGVAGAHNAHALVPAIGQDCRACHGGYSQAMPSNNMEIGFRGFSSQYGMVRTGTFLAYSGPLGNPKWLSTSIGTTRSVSSIVDPIGNAQDVQCSNLYCHGAGSTAPGLVRPALGGGNLGNAPYYVNPFWTGGVVCGDCHGATAGDPLTTPSGGSHQKHAVTVFALSCGMCHGEVADNGSHVNAQVTWNLDTSAPLIGANARYNGVASGMLPGLAPRGVVTAGDDYRRCNNIYCHSTVQGTNGTGFGIYSSKKWGGGSVTCDSCHKDFSTDTVGTGSHLAHAKTTNLAYACSTCHKNGGYGSQVHADGVILVNFTSSVGKGAGGRYGNYTSSILLGQKLAGSALYTTCSSTICHGTTSPAWGANVGTARCEKCHGYRDNTPVWRAVDGATATTDHRAGAHFNHISSTTYKFSKPYSCLECHSNSISVDSIAEVKNAAHFNNASSANVNWGTGSPLAKTLAQTPAYGVASKQCSNVYCHGGGMDTNVSNPPASRIATPSWRTPFLGVASVVGNGSTTPGSGDCATCHGYPPMKGTTHNLKTAVECTVCHTHVNTAGTGFKNAWLHVDGIVQAVGGHSFPYRGNSHMSAAGSTPWSACSTCHTTSGTSAPYPIARPTAPDCAGCHKRPSNETSFGLRAASGTNACYDCHGRTAGAIANYSGARPNGNLFPNISGSHTRHVVNAAMTCNDCHLGSGTGTAKHGFGNHSAHTNAFVNLSSPSRKFVFTWAGGTGKGTCSTNTCHSSAEWGVTKLACNSCHSYLAADGWTSTYGIEGNSATAHQKHITYLAARAGVTLNASSDTFGGATYTAVCGVCHTVTPSDHSKTGAVNSRNINFGGSTARQFGASAPFYNGVNGQSSSVNPKSCMNTDCHYRTSPIWKTY